MRNRKRTSQFRRMAKRAASRAGEVEKHLEKDRGFEKSHGYGPGHGGPSGPGDVPADETPAGAARREPLASSDDEKDE